MHAACVAGEYRVAHPDIFSPKDSATVNKLNSTATLASNAMSHDSGSWEAGVVHHHSYGDEINQKK